MAVKKRMKRRPDGLAVMFAGRVKQALPDQGRNFGVPYLKRQAMQPRSFRAQWSRMRLVPVRRAAGFGGKPTRSFVIYLKITR